MFSFRSVSKQIITIQEQIRQKQREIEELQSRVLLLQQACEHVSRAEVEDIEGHGWVSCDECGSNLYQLY